MIPLDLSGKLALVTGVGDDFSFAWYIAKGLQAAGARLIFACHPWFISIVENILVHDGYADARTLPFGAGMLKVEKVFPCDVRFDTLADVSEDVRQERRFKRCEQQYGDYSIQGLMEKIGKDYQDLDILIHSIAFSREIKTHKAFETSRAAYLEAMSISAYSLTALLRAALPFMENRPEGTSAVGLTYIGGERVIPHFAANATWRSVANSTSHWAASRYVRLPCNLGVTRIPLPRVSLLARVYGEADGKRSPSGVKHWYGTANVFPRGGFAMILAQEQAFLKSETQLQELLTYVQQAAASAERIDQVERTLLERLLELGHTLLTAYIATQSDGDQGPPAAAAVDRTHRRLPKLHRRRYVSIFGVLEISRAVYGTREGQKIEWAPLDGRLDRK